MENVPPFSGVIMAKTKSAKKAKKPKKAKKAKKTKKTKKTKKAKKAKKTNTRKQQKSNTKKIRGKKARPASKKGSYTRKRKRKPTTKPKRSRSEAAKLGWKRRKAKERKLAREAARRRKIRSEAAILGWQRRRDRAERKAAVASGEVLPLFTLHDIAVETGEVKPRTQIDRIRALLGKAKLRDSDRVYVFANADGSIDGELDIPTTNEDADRDIILIGENLTLGPNMYVSVGVHARVISGYKYRSTASTRPSEPLPTGEGLDSLSAIYTNWYPRGREVNAFIVSRRLLDGTQSAPAVESANSIIYQVVESDKTGDVEMITVRVFWSPKGLKPGN